MTNKKKVGKNNSISYKDAGVDIDKADEFVSEIIPLMEKTHSTRVVRDPKGFGGLFSLDYKEKLFAKRYKDPVLVACSDGVGTKLEIAKMMNRYDTVGIDVVAMCLNDMIVYGAEPLFFLDYVASSKLEKDKLKQLISGVVKGCQQASCTLLGGETAEMPGFYKKGDYELVGFAVGVIERKKIRNKKIINKGDILIGLASNGLHSNGFSLTRKIFFEKKKMKVNDILEETGSTLGEELLRPTKIYVKTILNLLSQYKRKRIVKAIANITGGGVIENVPRILPENLNAVIKKKSFEKPKIFDIIKKIGKIDEKEMYRTFNMGLGMVMIVPPYNQYAVQKKLKRLKQKSWIIGKITKGNKSVELI